MSYQSYSSIGTSRRSRHHPIDRYTDVDRSVYTVGQTLASIVNDPRTAGQTSGGFWGLAHDASQAPTAPPLDPTRYPPVTKADVQQYINQVHEAYDRFIRDRQSLEVFDAQHHPGSPRAGLANQGEPFMAAVQAVPMQFFQEGFFDNWDDIFKQYCKDQSADELYEQIDQLNKNLDVVELQLLREVGSRSDSFFQAAATLQDLLGMLGESVSNIRGLRKTLAVADEQLCSTAGAVKALQARRSNLQATLDITKGLEEVTAAQQALDCLLESQDYAGALDLLEQMKSLLEQPSLLGLQCVRHLPPRLADTTTAVEGALGNEFLNTVANADVARVIAQAASDAEAQPDAGAAVDSSGAAFWQLPPAAAGTSSSIPPAVIEQLQDKLLALAVGLYRCDRLSATLQQYKANVGEEVRSAVRDVVQQVLPLLLSAAGDGAAVQQQSAADGQLSEQLQYLHHGAFMVLLHAAARVIYSCVDHAVSVGRLLENILEGVNTPASQLLSIRKECAGALQVVVDVALGRWVKLLSSRGAAHTRLKQYELRQLLDLSEQVAAYTESLGARTPTSFRAALQHQCKSLLDHSHARCMNQLQHLLESEQWVAVEVPGGFQAIVDRMVARCGEGAALLDGRVLPATGSCSRSRTPSTDGSAAAGDSSSSEQHSPKLQLSGNSFHLVNTALMLLKMLEEYMALYDLMPQFGAEIVHRELELLKLFNSQTAALVLGAGAMRTAGLRSISAKQLALSCQSVAMVATLLPLLRAGSLALVSQPRRALLMPEFDRLLQDLTMHMDEVHSKLVDIMRDRLSAAVQTLPGEIKSARPGSEQPSQTVMLLAKQLGTLRSVLVPLLLKEEVEFIFGAVARAYSDGLSELFEVLMAQDGGHEGVIRVNALTMLQAFRDLPLDSARASNYSSRLSTTYTKHFGLPPWDQEKLGHRVQQPEDQQQQQQQQHGGQQQQQQHQMQVDKQAQQQLLQQQELEPQEGHPDPRQQSEAEQQQQQLPSEDGSLDAYQETDITEQQQPEQRQHSQLVEQLDPQQQQQQLDQHDRAASQQQAVDSHQQGTDSSADADVSEQAELPTLPEQQADSDSVEESAAVALADGDGVSQHQQQQQAEEEVWDDHSRPTSEDQQQSASDIAVSEDGNHHVDAQQHLLQEQLAPQPQQEIADQAALQQQEQLHTEQQAAPSKHMAAAEADDQPAVEANGELSDQALNDTTSWEAPGGPDASAAVHAADAAIDTGALGQQDAADADAAAAGEHGATAQGLSPSGSGSWLDQPPSPASNTSNHAGLHEGGATAATVDTEQASPLQLAEPECSTRSAAVDLDDLTGAWDEGDQQLLAQAMIAAGQAGSQSNSARQSADGSIEPEHHHKQQRQQYDDSLQQNGLSPDCSVMSEQDVSPPSARHSDPGQLAYKQVLTELPLVEGSAFEAQDTAAAAAGDGPMLSSGSWDPHNASSGPPSASHFDR